MKILAKLKQFAADKKQPETLEEQVAAICVVDQKAPVNGAAVVDGKKENEKLRNLWPNGFFKLLRGDDTIIAIGHYCPDCKLLSLPAGPEIKHCGRVSFRPENFFQMLFVKKTTAGVRWI